MSLESYRPRIRLLFDENLPWRVAAALHVLDFPVSYVGDRKASPASPLRGSSDEVVLKHAERFNQVVVTSNLDMILLCVERRQRVVWIDPRGSQLRREDFVILVFKNISNWAKDFQSTDGPVCLRVMRTKTVIVELDEADRLVRNRMSRISLKKLRSKKSKPMGTLFEDLGS